jgi:NADH:ubiquinone oxidoreductase subunit 4 (subunit M)
MIFISILTLIVAKALPSFSRNLSSFTRISAIIFIYSGVLSFNTFYIQSIGSGIGLYSGLFQITQVSVLIEVFFLLIGFLILIAWPLEIQNTSTNKDYSLIVLFSTLGSCLLISSSDLISMYLSIELQSFGLYILSTLYRDSESSTSAGLKYFLLGGLSSCIILLGCGIIYSLTGLTNFDSIYSIISSAFYLNNIIQGLILGLLFIIIGFLFKIAAAPLHNWAPALCIGKTHKWVKLSNSGDFLKLMIPNNIRKSISGQNNYLDMVISHKMNENEMEYRGSKSGIIKMSVKEQRVDGSWFLTKKLAINLRCTLMGFERNYQVKIPSKQ